MFFLVFFAFVASVLGTTGNNNGENSIRIQRWNVYGEDLQVCRSRDRIAQDKFCPYHAAESDPGAHEVCVTSLPKQFSEKTGQGKWSEAKEGQSWCVCIWAWSNYVLNVLESKGDANRFSYHEAHNKLEVDCNAIPEEALNSEYSLDHFKACGSMDSPCPQYVAAIKDMCSYCKQQKLGSSSKTVNGAIAALDDKCNRLVKAAEQERKTDQHAHQELLSFLSSLPQAPVVFVIVSVASMLLMSACLIHRYRQKSSSATSRCRGALDEGSEMQVRDVQFA